MRIYRKLYQKTLLALLGVTKIVSSTERSIPGKWHNVIDSVRVSSQVLHLQLSVLDEEVAEEFQELERNLNKKIGKGKLYTEDDLREAKERISRVEF